MYYVIRSGVPRTSWQLDILPVVHRRKLKDLTTFYKMKNGLYDCNVYSYMKFCLDSRLRFSVQGKLKHRRPNI